MQNKIKQFMNERENCVAAKILDHFITLDKKDELNTTAFVVREITPIIVILNNDEDREIANDIWQEYGHPHILFQQHIPSFLPFDVFVDTGYGNLFVCIKSSSYLDDGSYDQVLIHADRVDVSGSDTDYYITHVCDAIQSSWGKTEKNSSIHEYITISKTMRFVRSV